MHSASLHALFVALYDSALGHFMRDYALPSSIAVVLHLIGLVLLGGPALVVGLFVTGVLRHGPDSARVDRELWPLFVSGVILTLITGVALVAAKGDYYYESTVFWVKIGLLVPATVGSVLLHFHLARAKAPEIAVPWRITGAANVLLWAGVAIAGRGIGLI